jgi:hypothetical protein
MTDIKPIFIIGQNNKYQIKKLTTHATQVNKATTNDILSIQKIEPIITKHLLPDAQYIKNKLQGYKQQDKKRGFAEDLITLDELMEKLRGNPLVCHYCAEPLVIQSSISKDMRQWTLDRVNNDVGHTAANTIISCLGCNLRRRRIASTAFDFSTKLTTIIKNPA